MAKIWRNRIIAGDKLYKDCPADYKAAVKKLLKEDVKNKVITAEQYQEFVGEPYK